VRVEAQKEEEEGDKSLVLLGVCRGGRVSLGLAREFGAV